MTTLASNNKLSALLAACWLFATTMSLMMQLTYGQEIEQQQQAAFFNDPLPLVFMFNHEQGSGEGRPSPFQLQPSESLLIDSSSSSVSPSLITAKCWNNYETNDPDCKQINVITASNSDNNNQYNQHQHNNGEDDDSLITPVVIFESSSTFESGDFSASSGQQAPPTTNHQLAPPYFSSSSPVAGSQQPPMVLTRHRTPPPTANDQFAAPPAGATLLPPASGSGGQQRGWQPVTRPTSSVFVATPRPAKQPKTTTAGRKCRDENDADCDEPEESNSTDEEEDDDGDKRRPSLSKWNTVAKPQNNDEQDNGDDTGSETDDREDELNNNRVTNESSPAGETSDQEPVEFGSGSGPMDDNENDVDEDPDGEISESSGSSEPPTGRPQEEEGGGKFVQVASDYRPKLPNYQSQDINNKPLVTVSTTTTTTTPEPTTTSVAEIHVIVHSTLPPTFPIAASQQPTGQSPSATTITIDESIDLFTSQATMTTPMTNMPDDTYTVKPVFPSTSQAPESTSNNQGATKSYDDSHEEGAGKEDFTERPNGGQTSTTENLSTFVPVPMPVAESESNRRLVSNNLRSNQSSAESQQLDPSSADSNKLDDMYRFRVPSANGSSGSRVDNGWRKPAAGAQGEHWSARHQRPRQQEQLVTGAGTSINQPAESSSSGVKRVQTSAEVLPQLLIYASIVIIVVTGIIFTIVSLAFWRRNSARQRALLMHKRQLLNGGPNQPQMVGSMSQGSQLIVNMQQPGLLSTYGPGKSLAMGKVTASVIKSSNENIVEEDEDEDDEEEDDNLVQDDGKDLGSLNGANSNNGNQHRGGNNLNSSAATRSHTNPPIDQMGANSSWSNSEDQTTTATTTTTNSSSGSQRTSDSRQQVAMMQQGTVNQMTMGGQLPSQQPRVHYSNSLSDERQNSSSISDSQCSPVDNGPMPLAPSMIVEARKQQQLQQQQQQLIHPRQSQHQPAAVYPAQQPPVTYRQHPQMYDAEQQQHVDQQAAPYYATQRHQPTVINQDSVKRFNDPNRYMAVEAGGPMQQAPGQGRFNEPYVTQQPVSMQHPAAMGQPMMVKNPMGVPLNRPFPPPSPASSYTSSTLPRHFMNQQSPAPNGEAYQYNGAHHNGTGNSHQRLGNGYMHRNTISMEFSNEFDAHV